VRSAAFDRVKTKTGVASAWVAWLPALADAMRRLQVTPERTLVLVPYAQLMDAGRRAWAVTHADGFSPRFESTRNWAQTLEPFVPGPSDVSMDMARDSLMAAAFIDRVASGRTGSALRTVMISRLVEAARQLAPLAAAIAPDQRLAWADGVRAALTLPQQALHLEGMLASLAVAWVSTSAFATDVLWGPLGQPGRDADALLVLPGFQPDPLVKALAQHWGDRAVVLEVVSDLSAPRPMPEVGLHLCADPEDEAQRSAACVIAQLHAGRSPVALVANDRMLTRRVSAMLHGAGMAVRDETGWKLSTSHAAAQFMALLRASKRRASMDDVLEWLKYAPAWSELEVTTLERWAREQGIATWHAALQPREAAPALPSNLATLLDGLQAPRPLVQWLADLTKALQACGLWTAWQADLAGQQLIQVLRLGEGAAWDLGMVGQSLASDAASVLAQTPAARPGVRLTQTAFTGWVREVLEGASFLPRSAGDADVVILPMPQLLGRVFGAVVVPGCDETHLNPSPEPPGQWTVAQRDLLGLPSREVLAAAAAQAWQTTLGQSHLDVLWRAQERGEAVLPSPWVQALSGSNALAADPRAVRPLATQVAPRPSPSAGDLLPESLSASSYQDLRDCPYRFFSLRLLKLSEVQELEDEPDARDMGNWLHLVLRCFHEQRGDARPGRAADEEALDQLAESTAATMGLNSGEGGAGFLPYQAVWPRLRDGYLDWLEGFEASGSQPGPRFERAEAAMSAHAGEWKLFGKLDRIDQQDSPEGVIPFVIDYKTENRQKTQDRVKQPLEDTQLAFYAALLPEDNLRAAYLSITDKRGEAPKDAPTLLVEQVDVLLAREHLRLGLAHDMARIAAGAPLPALGEGRVCDFCAARGLCRRDHWER
jgi:ATP-dependent helicase/nuclease subunit B